MRFSLLVSISLIVGSFEVVHGAQCWDNTDYLYQNKNNKNCAWVGERKRVQRCKLTDPKNLDENGEKVRVSSMCPMTCNACLVCEDTVGRIPKVKNKYQKCTQITNKNRCDSIVTGLQVIERNGIAANYCPKTCGKCLYTCLVSPPTDSPTTLSPTATLTDSPPTSSPIAACPPFPISVHPPPDAKGANTFAARIVTSKSYDGNDDLVFVSQPGVKDLFGNDSQGIVYVYKADNDMTMYREVRDDNEESGVFGRVIAVSQNSHNFATTIGKIQVEDGVETNTCVRVFKDGDSAYVPVGNPVCNEGGFGAAIAAGDYLHGCGGGSDCKGGWILVGAPYSRKFYVLKQSYLSSTMTYTEFTQDDKNFGRSIAIYPVSPFVVDGSVIGDLDFIAAVGAAEGYSGGAVHIYYNNDKSWTWPSWKHLDRLHNASPLFGTDVAITKGPTVNSYFIIIADPGNAAYVYKLTYYRDTPNPEMGVEYHSKLTSVLVASNEKFASSVAISNDLVVISSEKTLTTGNSYVFTFDGTSWNEQGAIVGENASLTHKNGGLVTKSSDWSDILSLSYAKAADVCTGM